jgi:ribonuclease HI
VYTDGSVNKHDKKVGCSFVVPEFKYSRGFRLPGDSSILTAELIAIVMSLEWIDEVKPSNVVIFSDCMSAIMSVQKFNPDNKIVHDIQKLNKSLCEQGIMVEIAWVPAHVGVFGNEWADYVAKKASEYRKIDIHVKLNTSEVKNIYKAQMKIDWQTTWNNYNNNNNLRVIQPNIKLHMENWKVSRTLEVQFHQLRLGKSGYLNHFLHGIKQHPDGKCDRCGIKEDVKHFLLECDGFKSERKDLMETLEVMGFNVPICNMDSLLGGKNPPVSEVMNYVYKYKPFR